MDRFSSQSSRSSRGFSAYVRRKETPRQASLPSLATGALPSRAGGSIPDCHGRGSERKRANAETRLHISFSFLNAAISKAGLYILRITVDGRTGYETTFSIKQGTPEDFKA